MMYFHTDNTPENIQILEEAGYKVTIDYSSQLNTAVISTHTKQIYSVNRNNPKSYIKHMSLEALKSIPTLQLLGIPDIDIQEIMRNT